MCVYLLWILLKKQMEKIVSSAADQQDILNALQSGLFSFSDLNVNFLF